MFCLTCHNPQKPKEAVILPENYKDHAYHKFVGIKTSYYFQIHEDFIKEGIEASSKVSQSQQEIKSIISSIEDVCLGKVQDLQEKIGQRLSQQEDPVEIVKDELDQVQRMKILLKSQGQIKQILSKCKMFLEQVLNEPRRENPEEDGLNNFFDKESSSVVQIKQEARVSDEGSNMRSTIELDESNSYSNWDSIQKEVPPSQRFRFYKKQFENPRPHKMIKTYKGGKIEIDFQQKEIQTNSPVVFIKTLQNKGQVCLAFQKGLIQVHDLQENKVISDHKIIYKCQREVTKKVYQTSSNEMIVVSNYSVIGLPFLDGSISDEIAHFDEPIIDSAYLQSQKTLYCLSNNRVHEINPSKQIKTIVAFPNAQIITSLCARPNMVYLGDNKGKCSQFVQSHKQVTKTREIFQNKGVLSISKMNNLLIFLSADKLERGFLELTNEKIFMISSPKPMLSIITSHEEMLTGFKEEYFFVIMEDEIQAFEVRNFKFVEVKGYVLKQKLPIMEEVAADLIKWNGELELILANDRNIYIERSD